MSNPPVSMAVAVFTGQKKLQNDGSFVIVLVKSVQFVSLMNDIQTEATVEPAIYSYLIYNHLLLYAHVTCGR